MSQRWPKYLHWWFVKPLKAEMCSFRQLQHISLIFISQRSSSGTLQKLLEWNLFWKTKSTCVTLAGEGLSAWILSVWMNSECFWVFVRTLTCSQNESDVYMLSWTMTYYLRALDMENKRHLEYLHVYILRNVKQLCTDVSPRAMNALDWMLIICCVSDWKHTHTRTVWQQKWERSYFIQCIVIGIIVHYCWWFAQIVSILRKKSWFPNRSTQHHCKKAMDLNCVKYLLK